MAAMKNKILIVNKLLIEKYGVPSRPVTPPDPVDLLIATILSQNTNDKNSFKAFQNLKKHYPDWHLVAGLSAASIEKLIKAAGLGRQKSKAIKLFLSRLLKKQNNISLDHLKDLTNDDVLAELTSNQGIGIKTASCVLLFSMRRNVCPVDTHVHRTTNRIGIVKASTPDKTFKILNAALPDNTAHSFHTNLIRLGREICKPAKPLCGICPLLKVCGYDKKNLEINSAYKEISFMLLDSIE